MEMKEIVPIERIEQRIFLIRGQKVMLDRDLAELYGVPTKRLNEAVKRNIRRFPEGFMFVLTKIEAENLRSQIATSSWGGRRYLPLAFTEQGVAMLSSVLNSERAIQINILIIKTFVRLRAVLSTHKELAMKFKELEGKVDQHDSAIQEIFEAIRKMIAYEEKPRRRMGFDV
jgi:phage regulator Rha-like protein